MTTLANSPIVIHPDASLSDVLSQLVGQDEKSLTFVYPDGTDVQAGYHVTEVKAGSFVTLDCGGNPDAWHETVLQVEDIPSRDGDGGMSVGKFTSILARVAAKIPLSAEARLTVEASTPGDAMRVHDVAAVEIEGERVVVQLAARPAICKPRHRAVQASATASACCGASTVDSRNACCA